MLSLLRSNTAIHLKFYGRNRLLLGFALVMSLVFGLSFVPMILFESSSSDRFSTLKAVSQLSSTYALVFTASLGLFAMASHLRNRNLKMVFTKPCVPEIWLASLFLAAILVAGVVYGLTVLVSLALSMYWHLPWQWGFVFVAIDSWCRAVIQLSFLTCLTTLVHPVIAVLIALFLNDATLYEVKLLFAGSLASGGSTPGRLVGSVLCDVVYMLLPMADPLGKRSEGVYSSLRVSSPDWLHLSAAFAYTVLVSAFFFFLAAYRLRRKTLI